MEWDLLCWLPCGCCDLWHVGEQVLKEQMARVKEATAPQAEVAGLGGVKCEKDISVAQHVARR